MNEAVTRSQFEEFKATAIDVILQSVEKFGDMLYPTFLFQHEDKSKSSFIVPDFLMANQFTKAVVGETVKEKIKEHKIQFVCFATAAYALQVDPGEDKPKGSLEHDDRSVEIIMVQLESKPFKHTTQFRVTRENGERDGKIISLDPFKDEDISDIVVGGNFAGFFNEE